ncbi:MAG: pyridoxal-phosphate dependent enzyme, partial [Myxococcota bacterium]
RRSSDLSCDLILVTRMGPRESAWFRSGNRLLDKILGARIHPVDDERQAAQQAARLLEEARAQKQNLYVIPVGGSNAVGELGYVDCALELHEQILAGSLNVSNIFHATSSLGTQSGLVVGLSALGSEIDLAGIGVDHRLTPAEQTAEIAQHAQTIARMLDVPTPAAEQIRVDGRQLGEGYGVTTEAALEAIGLAARHQGLLLDPVYTGKAMAGLIEAIRCRELPGDQAVIFLHTGGSAGLFAYRETVEAGLGES